MKKTKKNAKKAPEKKAPKKTAKKPAGKTPAKKAKAAKKPVKKAPEKAAKMPAPRKSPGADTLTRTELSDIASSLNEVKIEMAKNVEDKRSFDILEPEVGDSIDQATQSLDKEILFELSDNERRILRDIDAALRKLEKGTYGYCEHCKQPIQKRRLKALPSARYCMVCQSGSEKSGG